MAATETEIRKAFEVKLLDAIEAAYGANSWKSLIDWPNRGFSDSVAAPDLWLRPTLISNRGVPRTLGPTPREEKRGIWKVQVFAKGGKGTDALDTLAEIVKAAYPYSVDLVAGGAKIQINGREIGDLLTPPGRAVRPVDINWSIGI